MPCTHGVFAGEDAKTWALKLSGAVHGKRHFRSVIVQRPYRDRDESCFVTSFGLAELPQAIRVLQLAQEHVDSAEANGWRFGTCAAAFGRLECILGND